jgi:hypothetical protein
MVSKPTQQTGGNLSAGNFYLISDQPQYKKVQNQSGNSARYKILNNSGVDPKLFFLDPYPDPNLIFLCVLDPDPAGPVKSSGSSSGSDPKYSLFHNANNYKRFFHGILKHPFQ